MKIHFLKGVWKDIIILESEEEIAFIDTGYEEDYEQIKDYLDKLGKNNISFILLTHFHRDHYGCIPFLVKNYKINKVYFKNYSALDKTTATGTIADDLYRQNEKEKCEEIKNIIKENSELVEVEKVKSIKFGSFLLNLFNNNNTIQKIYEDKNSPYYHKYAFNENQNSLTVFIKVNGVNVYFGGDVMDKEREHQLANFNNRQAAYEINEEIDIYKVPHHGTSYCNSNETLEIFKPKIAIISNSLDYLENVSTVLDELKSANENVKILLTDKSDVVIDIDSKGNICIEE